MGVLLAVIVALFVQGAAPRQEPASQQPPSGSQQSPGGQQPNPGTQPVAGASRDDSSDRIWSIERIKKELARKPTLTFTMPDPNSPRYRVEIRGRHALTIPSFSQSFQIPPSPVPQPFGGSDYYNMMRLNTPPQYWGSAPFTNADLLGMWGLTGAYGLAGALIKKGIEARHNAAAARAHQEVLQELSDLEARNARIAAGQADDDAKSAAQKKKKQEGEKTKKGPG